jgi:hypothetical protein
MGRNSFLFNREYQRGKVWGKEKQQRLIESIIKNLSIGLLIVKEDHQQRFEVLDGQQRLETIFLFIEGNICTPAELEAFPEKKYADLQNDLVRRPAFDNFSVYYDEVLGGNDAEIADIFLRLQEGVPLNSAEKLNATLGKMRDFVFEVSRHAFFKKDIKIDEGRFAHRYLAAQMVFLQLESEFYKEQFPEFGDPRFVKLKKMYRDHKLRVPRDLRREVYRTINSLHRMLQADAQVIHEKSDLPMLYLLISYLSKKYAVKRSLLRKFIVEFFTKVAQLKIEEGQKPKDAYEQYATLRGKGLTSETMKTRFNILLGLFLSKNSKIHLKDPRRLFDIGQKLAIYYYKNKGKCQYASCHKKVKWDEASFHHTKFHSKGGLTTVENGRLMHKVCHSKYHANVGSDDDLI